MYKRRFSFILVLLFILSSAFTAVAYAHQGTDHEAEEPPFGLSFILVDESTPENEIEGPETPSNRHNKTLASEEQLSFMSVQNDSYNISSETTLLAIQTFINESGEQVFPWELQSDELFTYERYENGTLTFSMGQIVEVDVILIRPNERIEVNENEITLATDGQFLFVIWPSFDEEPELIEQGGSDENSVMSSAPWRFRRLSVLESIGSPLYWVHGDIQIAAQVISNGNQASLFNERERTGAFSEPNSNLHLTRGPTILRNNTHQPHIEANFEVRRLNGSNQNILFALFFNGAGNITSHIAHGLFLNIRP